MPITPYSLYSALGCIPSVCWSVTLPYLVRSMYQIRHCDNLSPWSNLGAPINLMCTFVSTDGNCRRKKSCRHDEAVNMIKIETVVMDFELSCDRWKTVMVLLCDRQCFLLDLPHVVFSHMTALLCFWTFVEKFSVELSRSRIIIDDLLSFWLLILRDCRSFTSSDAINQALN